MPCIRAVWVACKLDAGVKAARCFHERFALARRRGVAPELHRCEHVSVRIEGYKPMLLTGNGDRLD